jgi:hypothetical protein
MSCVHNSGFGASLGCSKCNKALAALIDSDICFGKRDFVGVLEAEIAKQTKSREQFLQDISDAIEASSRGMP